MRGWEEGETVGQDLNGYVKGGGEG